MNDLQLVYLETSGNQAYIFGTNKLAEIVGASELVRRVGTQFVDEAVGEVFGRKVDRDHDLTKEPAINEAKAKGVERIVATSGKALLLVRGDDKEDGEKKAKRFVTAWSRRVLTNAPGVDATAVFTTVDMAKSRGLDEAISRDHALFEFARLRRTAPQARFPRLPIIAECRTSGLPASENRNEGSGNSAISLDLSRVALTKREARKSDPLKDRLRKIGGTEKLFDNLEKLEGALEGRGGLEWLAVVHADGNGLGALFMSFQAYVLKLLENRTPWLNDALKKAAPTPDHYRENRAYIEVYRRFSVELDRIAEGAFRDALKTLKTDPYKPVVPIVVGGDDLTVLVDGKQALRFAATFVETFTDLTAAPSSEIEAVPAIVAVAGEKLGAARLGMCAGVSITKPHFPFSKSYDLAEELLRSAKKVKQKANYASSAIDFHVLYDSSATSIEAIREKLRRVPSEGELKEEANLTRKPFVVKTDGSVNKGDWCKCHDWKRFEAAVAAVRASKDDSERRDLPNSQAHGLREALFREEVQTLEAEFEILCSRYPTFGDAWRKIERPNEKVKLFQKDDGPDSTLFLDALEALSFLDKDPTTSSAGGEGRQDASSPSQASPVLSTPIGSAR